MYLKVQRKYIRQISTSKSAGVSAVANLGARGDLSAIVNVQLIPVVVDDTAFYNYFSRTTRCLDKAKIEVNQAADK